MEEIIYILISFVLLYIAYKIKSKGSSAKPSRELEELGKKYLDRITKNYEKGQKATSTKPVSNYINPCVDSQDKYISSTIPYFTIAYGTQSGTAKKFADLLQREAIDNLGVNCSVVNVSELKLADFNENALIVFIVSTYGDGGPSDDSVDFNEMIKGDELWDKIKNKNLNYTVFGLGCSFYTKFNAQAKFIDKVLAKHGVRRICEIGLGDEAKGYNEDFAIWKKMFFRTSYEYFIANSDMYKDFKANCNLSKVNVEELYQIIIGQGDSLKDTETSIDNSLYDHSLNKMFLTSLAPIESISELRKQTVNGSTLKVTFDLTHTGISYNVGDNIAIYPKNSMSSVVAFASQMQYELSDKIKYKFISDSAKNNKLNLPLPNDITIKDALESYIDLSCQINKDAITKIKKFIANEDQYKEVCSIIEDKEKLNEFLSQRYNIVDFVTKYNSVNIPFTSLIKILPKISPRYYTIASSPNHVANKLDIAITLVSWNNYKGDRTYGLMSNFFNALYKSKSKDSLLVVIKKSSFRLPEQLSTPMMMICTGSGIAPFVSFLQEFDKRNEKGSQRYLIFGSKNRQSDFIFEDELEGYKRKGVLTELHGAFSRDDPHKKTYVQDVLKEKYGDRLKELIKEKKMFVYVCGSLSMGNMVKSLISETVGKETYDEMEKEKRLITEFWENK